jgi:hypothetical protein
VDQTDGEFQSAKRPVLTIEIKNNQLFLIDKPFVDFLIETIKDNN